MCNMYIYVCVYDFCRARHCGPVQKRRGNEELRPVHQTTSGVRVVHRPGNGHFLSCSRSINSLLQGFKGHMRCGHKTAFDAEQCRPEFVYAPETQVQIPQQNVSVRTSHSSCGAVNRALVDCLWRRRGGERWGSWGLLRRWHGRAQLSVRLTGIGCYFRISRWAAFGRTERPPRSWTRNRCSSK